jgi:OmpA-OmpF porin, OOP family
MEEHPLSDSGLRSNCLVHLLVGASTCAAVLVAAPTVSAQNSATGGTFTVQRFNPAPGPRNFLTTRGIRTDGQMAWSGSFVANWGWKPFVVVSRDSTGDTPTEDVMVVENVATGDFMGSLTIIPKLQLGLRIPVTYVRGQGLTAQGEGDPNNLSAVGMGDVEVEGKYRLIGAPTDMFVLGGGVFVTAPTGNLTAKDKYIGDATVTAGARAIVDFNTGPLFAGANLIGVYRGEGRVGDTTMGPEFRYSLAVGYEISPLIRVIADGFGGTKFSGKAGTNTLEADLGARVHPLDTPVFITAGAGAGLIQGIGVPMLRAFAGFMYVAEGLDKDGDGIQDDKDQCPASAEDKDGFEDADGCPDVDNDDDSVPDAQDKCPSQAEDPDGFKDLDGCPDPDNDLDGVPDDKDQCADKPETKNGYKDDDGCPDELDSDQDGVPDTKDKCPKEAEDTDGFQDEDGCPDLDNDNDGIPDNGDECIDEPEDKDGDQDEDGCPDGEQPAAGAAPAPAPAAPAPAKP